MRIASWIVCIVLAVPALAHAYPQYQLRADATCTGCHLSPAGGGLLSENGLAVAETSSWSGGDPAFLHAIVEPPGWLQLGGEVRFASGMSSSGTPRFAAFPMQVALGAAATVGAFSLVANGGLRGPKGTGSTASVVASAFWSPEHYAMWRQNPDSTEGFYARVGRFSPVFGLRAAEHVAYSQRFGGAPLFDQTYGAAAEYVSQLFEVHATGFLEDPIGNTATRGDGGALYAEVRPTGRIAIGLEGKYVTRDEARTGYVGVTGKLWLEQADVLLEGEAEIIRRTFPSVDRSTGYVGYVRASKPLGHGLALDLGVGHYQADKRIDATRQAFDLDLHWFQSSHLEWLLTTRLELVDGGSTRGGYVLGQIHYRL